VSLDVGAAPALAVVIENKIVFLIVCKSLISRGPPPLADALAP
jgi:hypothetical protein